LWLFEYEHWSCSKYKWTTNSRNDRVCCSLVGINK
jgi:hypothetical protein